MAYTRATAVNTRDKDLQAITVVSFKNSANLCVLTMSVTYAPSNLRLPDNFMAVITDLTYKILALQPDNIVQFSASYLRQKVQGELKKLLPLLYQSTVYNTNFDAKRLIFHTLEHKIISSCS